MYIRESEQHPPTNELESVKSKVDEGCSSEEGGGGCAESIFLIGQVLYGTESYRERSKT